MVPQNFLRQRMRAQDLAINGGFRASRHRLFGRGAEALKRALEGCDELLEPNIFLARKNDPCHFHIMNKSIERRTSIKGSTSS
jgi:hypothetical protein